MISNRTDHDHNDPKFKPAQCKLKRGAGFWFVICCVFGITTLEFDADESLSLLLLLLLWLYKVAPIEAIYSRPVYGRACFLSSFLSPISFAV